MPAATATAMSRARNDLQHLGSPQTMPTACSDHRPAMSQRCSSLRSARRHAGSTGSGLIGAVPIRAWSRRQAERRSPGIASRRYGGPRAAPRPRATRRRWSSVRAGCPGRDRRAWRSNPARHGHCAPSRDFNLAARDEGSRARFIDGGVSFGRFLFDGLDPLIFAVLHRGGSGTGARINGCAGADCAAAATTPSAAAATPSAAAAAASAPAASAPAASTAAASAFAASSTGSAALHLEASAWGANSDGPTPSTSPAPELGILFAEPGSSGALLVDDKDNRTQADVRDFLLIENDLVDSVRCSWQLLRMCRPPASRRVQPFPTARLASCGFASRHASHAAWSSPPLPAGNARNIAGRASHRPVASPMQGRSLSPTSITHFHFRLYPRRDFPGPPSRELRGGIVRPCTFSAPPSFRPKEIVRRK